MKFWVVINTKNKNDVENIEKNINELFHNVNIISINRYIVEYTHLYVVNYNLYRNKNNSYIINDSKIVGLTGWIKNITTNTVYSSYLNSNISAVNIEGNIIGEFSLCLVDKENIIIVTDHYSTNQVYYYIDSERTIFTSDVRILLLVDFMKYELNHEAIKYVLSKDYCIEDCELSFGNTFFCGIKKVPSNNMWVINKKTNLIQKNHPFINITPDIYLKNLNLEESVHFFKELLNDSVKDRVNAGATALMLSGGIDSSSIIASLMNIKYLRKINNYTISFPDKSLILSQDKYLVEKMVKDLSLNHEFVSLSEELRFCNNSDYIYYVDGPIPDVNPLGLIKIAKRILSKGDELVFTGEGGDVVLGEAVEDYLSDLIIRNKGLIYTNKYLKRMGYDSFIERLAVIVSTISPKLFFLLSRYIENIGTKTKVEFINYKNVNTSKLIRGLYKTNRDTLKGLKFNSAFNYHVYSHFYPRPAYISSTNSLYFCSNPLLDSRIISFIFSINPLHHVNYEKSDIHSSYENTKILARAAFKNDIPSYVMNKKRKTFYSLMSRLMFKNSAKDIFFQASNKMLLEEFGYINRLKYLDCVAGYILQVQDKNFGLGIHYQYIRSTYELEFWLSRFYVSKSNIKKIIPYQPILN